VSGLELVRVGEIARFLRQGPQEIRDMLEVDGLPHAKVPGKTKPAERVALRDLHRHLLKTWQGETVMRDFEQFRRAFWESVSGGEERNLP
jgi:hypothetical protein